MNIASPGRRILDGVVDLILLVLFVFLVSRYTGWGWTPDQQGDWGGSVHGWPFFILLLIGFVILGLIEAAFKKTPGKLIARIHVESIDGGPASFVQIMVRNILRVIDIIAVYLLGFIVIACTEKNQRVGDLCARTIVVDD
jgi:uncharacterized RDD family membrane protein YckC